jgi:hypothetical protein
MNWWGCCFIGYTWDEGNDIRMKKGNNKRNLLIPKVRENEKCKRKREKRGKAK